MNVHLTKSQMRDLAEDTDDVESDFKSVSRTIDELSAPDLTGFKTQQAIKDLNDRWPEKADHGAGRWQYFGGAIRETSENITSTDEEVAFKLPKDIPGVRN